MKTQKVPRMTRNGRDNAREPKAKNPTEGRGKENRNATKRTVPITAPIIAVTAARSVSSKMVLS